MRTLPWFELLDGEGVIAGWLASDEVPDHRHALELMLGAVKDRPDRMAELLAPHAGRVTDYPAWLSWITRFGSVPDSRGLFDLVLAAVRGDIRVLSMPCGWLCMLWASGIPSGLLNCCTPTSWSGRAHLDLNDSGQVAALRLTEHSVLELVSQSAEGAPAAFCELLLPYMLRVMQLTQADPQERPVKDRHFSYRSPLSGPVHDLDDALLRSASAALRELAERVPRAARPRFETLAADQHDGAQWLLYEGLRAAGRQYADWAAAILLFQVTTVWNAATQRTTSGRPGSCFRPSARTFRPSHSPNWNGQPRTCGHLGSGRTRRMGIFHPALRYGR